MVRGRHVDQDPPTVLGSGVAAISLGALHGRAKKTDGSLWCWGWNLRGQLGDCTTASNSAPIQVVALGSAVAEAAAGKFQSCARKVDGTCP